MSRFLAPSVSLCLVIALVGCGSQPTVVRFATFNASLNRDRAGQLAADLSTPDNQQARNVAEIVQRIRPDVLLINEFDYEKDGAAPELFQQNYLSVSQNAARPIEYPHRVYLPVNTGISSGFDLDRNGEVVTEPGSRGYGNDSLGFGQFPGQYGMLLLSRYPVRTVERIRTFQMFRWKDMPGAMLPTKEDGSPWYSHAELEVFRLSSKSHWDVPIRIGRADVHVLCSHPTPPAFDGPEQRNRKRNFDEIGFWAAYLSWPRDPNVARIDGFMTDDRGVPGGSAFGKPFVIMGDLNADPYDGSSIAGAIQQVLLHNRVNTSFTPASQGAVVASQVQRGRNLQHRGGAQYDTADFADTDPGPGNLRVDYVLPSNDLQIIDGGVFWPPTSDPQHRLVEMNPVASSDHRMVWLDVRVLRD